MDILLDLFVIAIVALTAFLSARHGFLRTCIEVVGFFLAIYLAFTLGNSLAKTTYRGTIEPGIDRLTQQVVGDNMESAEKTVDQIWAAVPNWLTSSAENAGVTRDAILRQLQQTSDKTGVGAVQLVKDRYVQPVAVSVLRLLFGILLSAVFLILVKILARVLGKLIKLPLVGTVNTVLGAVLGVVKGLIYAFILCSLLSALAGMTGGFLIFTPEAIARSGLFRLLASLNPVSAILFGNANV